MKKLNLFILLLIFCILSISFTNKTNKKEILTLKEELENSNLTLNYINHIINKINSTKGNKVNKCFIDTYMSSMESDIQQLYYNDIMYLLKGKYNGKDLVILKNMFFDSTKIDKL